MNIIICGAGRVGFTIAKLLTEQNHSITVIDQSGDDIQKINDSLDVKAIVGKATSPSVLERANTSDADMIIAVTRNDEINMLICQIAYSIFQVPKKTPRVVGCGGLAEAGGGVRGGKLPEFGRGREYEWLFRTLRSRRKRRVRRIELASRDRRTLVGI